MIVADIAVPPQAETLAFRRASPQNIPLCPAESQRQRGRSSADLRPELDRAMRLPPDLPEKKTSAGREPDGSDQVPP